MAIISTSELSKATTSGPPLAAHWISAPTKPRRVGRAYSSAMGVAAVYSPPRNMPSMKRKAISNVVETVAPTSSAPGRQPISSERAEAENGDRTDIPPAEHIGEVAEDQCAKRPSEQRHCQSHAGENAFLFRR